MILLSLQLIFHLLLFMNFKILLATKELRNTLKTPFEIEFFNDKCMETKRPWRNDREYLVAVDEHQNVVGVMCFVRDSVIGRQLSAGKLCIGFAYLSVSTFHKQRGIGKALARRLFDESIKMKRGIRITDYEPEGELYLKPVLREMAVEHPYSVYEYSTRIN